MDVDMLPSRLFGDIHNPIKVSDYRYETSVPSSLRVYKLSIGHTFRVHRSPVLFFYLKFSRCMTLFAGPSSDESSILRLEASSSLRKSSEILWDCRDTRTPSLLPPWKLTIRVAADAPEGEYVDPEKGQRVSGCRLDWEWPRGMRPLRQRHNDFSSKLGAESRELVDCHEVLFYFLYLFLDKLSVRIDSYYW